MAPAFALVPYEVGIGSQRGSISGRRSRMGRNGVEEGAPTQRRSVSDSRNDVRPCVQIWDGRLNMFRYTIPRAAGTSIPDLGRSASHTMDGSPSTSFFRPIVRLESPRAAERVSRSFGDKTKILWVGVYILIKIWGQIINGPLKGGGKPTCKQ